MNDEASSTELTRAIADMNASPSFNLARETDRAIRQLRERISGVGLLFGKRVAHVLGEELGLLEAGLDYERRTATVERDELRREARRQAEAKRDAITTAIDLVEWIATVHEAREKRRKPPEVPQVVFQAIETAEGWAEERAPF